MDRFLQKMDPRLAWLFALLCLTPLTLAPFYVLFLLFVPFGGVSLGDANALFLDIALVALDPLLAIAVGSWLLFSYLYSVAVPLAREIERGRLRAFLGFHAFKARLSAAGLTALLVSAGLALASQRLRTFNREIERALLEIHSLNWLISRGESPTHLAVGWAPSTHPQVVYH